MRSGPGALPVGSLQTTLATSSAVNNFMFGGVSGIMVEETSAPPVVGMFSQFVRGDVFFFYSYGNNNTVTFKIQ